MMSEFTDYIGDLCRAETLLGKTPPGHKVPGVLAASLQVSSLPFAQIGRREGMDPDRRWQLREFSADSAVCSAYA